jgi:hypothetical protein
MCAFFHILIGWPDCLFYLQKKNTDDRDFRPQICTNGLVFRECKHIKNNRNRSVNLIQNKVGYRSCFATGVKLEQFL